MLYSAYVNLRSFFSKNDIIKRRPRHPKTNVESSDESNIEIQEKLQFIQSNVLPFNEVVNAWKVTHLLRMNLLKDPELSTGQYLNKFPILSESIGHEMVIIAIFPFFYFLELFIYSRLLWISI